MKAEHSIEFVRSTINLLADVVKDREKYRRKAVRNKSIAKAFKKLAEDYRKEVVELKKVLLEFRSNTATAPNTATALRERVHPGGEVFITPCNPPPVCECRLNDETTYCGCCPDGTPGGRDSPDQFTIDPNSQRVIDVNPPDEEPEGAAGEKVVLIESDERREFQQDMCRKRMPATVWIMEMEAQLREIVAAARSAGWRPPLIIDPRTGEAVPGSMEEAEEDFAVEIRVRLASYVTARMARTPGENIDFMKLEAVQRVLSDDENIGNDKDMWSPALELAKDLKSKLMSCTADLEARKYKEETMAAEPEGT